MPAKSRKIAGRPNAAPEYLFVYGTLRFGFGAHGVLAGRAHPAGMGWMPGRLYDTGRYPAALAPGGPEDRVRGELYRLEETTAADLLRELDDYEGFFPGAPERSLFRRVRVEATADDGATRPAWTYLFNRPVHGLTCISSGDYADCLRSSGLA